MSLPFLEERLPACVRLGASWSDSYNVKVVVDAADREYRTLTHPFPIRRFRVTYVRGEGDTYELIMSLYHRCFGRFAGFRVRAHEDFSTNGRKGAPTAFDQPLAAVSAGVWQLQKQYGTEEAASIVGYPVRTIFKPVAGSVLVGIRNSLTGDQPITAFTVDTTTGRVTLAANKTRPITAITQAAQAVLTVGTNTFVVGESVHVSGVSGMTQINGRRAQVVARTTNTITLDINSTAFSAYTSGGTANTTVQSGETLHGGCYFDIPCRFDSEPTIEPLAPNAIEVGDVEIVELIAL